MVIYWDSMSDFENRMVSLRLYTGNGYTAGKTSFDVIKKNFYIKAHLAGKIAKYAGCEAWKIAMDYVYGNR